MGGICKPTDAFQVSIEDCHALDINVHSAGPRSASPSSPFSVSLFDDSAIFVDSYSGVLARVLSIYDGLFNPFRATALATWRRSSLLFSAFKFFAGIYQLGCNPNPQIRVSVDEARLGVLSQLSESVAELGNSVAVKQPEVMLVINMFGLSSSWYDLDDLGLEHYTAASILIRDGHGMKPSNYRFYEEFLVYWWMMLSFASGSDARNLQDPPTLTLRYLAEPRMPHPLTGVSPESQLLLGMVGRLVLTQRRAVLEQGMTSTHLPLSMTKNIKDARNLERRLLSLQLPPAHMILDPGDAHTSVQDLLSIAQAYRSCGLILLYHAYPGLVVDKNLCVVSMDSTTLIVDADRRRQSYLASLAFDVLNLLGQISPISGTRTIEAILLVIVSGELSLNGDASRPNLDSTPNEPALRSHSDTRSHSYLNSYTATAVLEARAAIIARFERIQAILPFKTIRRMKSLVTETWNLMDCAADNSERAAFKTMQSKVLALLVRLGLLRNWFAISPTIDLTLRRFDTELQSQATQSSTMHVLVVVCHPNQDSFTHAIAAQVIKGSQSKGHTVKVVDLYKDNFQPVFTPRDWEQFDGVPMPEDVLEQQRFVEVSDAIFLVFPIWWYQFPAMLKGYLDRVWSVGWCYTSERNTEGTLLSHRPCTVFALAGATSSQLDRWGYDKQIHHLWRYGIFGYCGFEPLRITILDDCSYTEFGKHAGHLQTAYEAGQMIGNDPEALPGIKPFLDQGLNIKGEKHVEA